VLEGSTSSTEMNNNDNLIENNNNKVKPDLTPPLRSKSSKIQSIHSPKSALDNKNLSQLNETIKNLSKLAGIDEKRGTSKFNKNALSDTNYVPGRNGLFEQARASTPLLPQYHPKQLLQLFQFGMVRRYTDFFTDSFGFYLSHINTVTA